MISAPLPKICPACGTGTPSIAYKSSPTLFTVACSNKDCPSAEINYTSVYDEPEATKLWINNSIAIGLINIHRRSAKRVRVAYHALLDNGLRDLLTRFKNNPDTQQGE